MQDELPPQTMEVPNVGSMVDTIYGRQQIMDVTGAADGETTVWLRPERGGIEWTVRASGFAAVVAARAET
ncbi:hypothetical protein [Yinghuangia soli]|uniref:Uncharacterized protein n=1 Tax=Yinghuangia soli TaxID=2908204 RepID=A0AA41U3L9_9ACTN|nr:hypothetical protein [Yinghuangia soli]MCF2531960.1 hypothetical protein [Yinghuangia soli]